MIRIGPAGSGLGNPEGVKKLHKLGLSALEIEFTYGVRMSDAAAKEIGKTAKKHDIALSVHAPYYINLASFDKEKIIASRKRILDSCRKAHLLGAKYVVFHPGFYQDRPENKVYTIIRNEIEILLSKVKKNKWRTKLAPETTGKPSQFGSIDELLRLRKDTGADICCDFAHILARQGSIDYGEVFNKLEPLKRVHAHFSGIEYSGKGERRHLVTKKSAIRPLLKEIIKRKADITIINESPSPLKDSLKTAEALGTLMKKRAGRK